MIDKKARANEIIERYRRGETLHSIGQSFDLTRERVRQILKLLGIDPMTGGAAISRFLAVEKKVIAKKRLEIRREERARRLWAISMADLRAIKEQYGVKPFRSYVQQRTNANNRGISWEMSFREWWDFWQEAGRWNQRGRGHGLCMARYGDVGPYSIENVYACTGAENFVDYRKAQIKTLVNTKGL